MGVTQKTQTTESKSLEERAVEDALENGRCVLEGPSITPWHQEFQNIDVNEALQENITKTMYENSHLEIEGEFELPSGVGLNYRIDAAQDATNANVYVSPR